MRALTFCIINPFLKSSTRSSILVIKFTVTATVIMIIIKLMIRPRAMLSLPDIPSPPLTSQPHPTRSKTTFNTPIQPNLILNRIQIVILLLWIKIPKNYLCKARSSNNLQILFSTYKSNNNKVFTLNRVSFLRDVKTKDQ